jgi:hypothetical protein
MVPDHPLNVQIFDFDALVLIDQFARLFEMKIASLPCSIADSARVRGGCLR